ncbi:cytochrome p450 [Moniliophthora roreri]|nr:cytochrome p450 [Moniliophthora roreri]
MKKEIHLKVNLHNEWQHHLKGSLQQLERFIISLKFQQFFQSTQLYTLSAITLGAAVIYLLKKRTLLNLPSGPPRKWANFPCSSLEMPLISQDYRHGLNSPNGGINIGMPMLPYGSAWKKQWRLANLVLSIAAVKKYHVLQSQIMAMFLQSLIEKLKKYANELHLWLPGVTFHKAGQEGWDKIQHLIERPFNYVKSQMEAGTARLSLTLDCMENFEALNKKATYATLMNFILTCIKYPEVLKKAQAEYDSIIGGSCLPMVEDHAFMPYINTCVKEAQAGVNMANLEKTHFYSFYITFELEHFNMTEDNR